MKIIKRLAIVTAIISTMLLSGCKQKVTFDEGYICQYSTETLSDNGVFFCQHFGSLDVPSFNLQCYYSVETGQVTPLCSKPNCTHDKATSPDCSAIGYASGMFPAGNNIYYLEQDATKDECHIVCADIANNTRKIIAAIEGRGWDNIESVRCQDGKLMFAVSEWYDKEHEKETHEPRLLDKYISTVTCVDLLSGEVKEVARIQEYQARISDVVLDGDTLIYFYSYYTIPIEDVPHEMGYEVWKQYYRYGANTVDLKTGEEKCLNEGYERMALTHESFDYFSRDNLIFYSTDTLGLYQYKDGEFTQFAKCWDYERFYMADDRAAIFQENEGDKVFKRYDFDSGETTEVSCENFTHKYLNGVITGDKVWFHGDYEGITGEKSDSANSVNAWGYMSRDDLMNGNFTGLTFAFKT